MRPKPQTVDDYLGAVPPDQRAALEHVRAIVASVAPAAEECIAYDLPSFRVNGKLLLCYGAAKKHCALYIGAEPIRRHAADLEPYDTAKGTIRFTPSTPLPDALVRKLVRTRLKERTA
ncbi:MAG TPA: DUF1801 domain-containing protein [Candidatus Baltobacteraceae bacterium]